MLAVVSGQVTAVSFNGDAVGTTPPSPDAAVTLQSLEEKSDIVILVDDDGPGILRTMRDEVLQRGVRADETAPGSGLGLSIVRDLAELYRGSISLEDSPMGGLRARLRLPAS